MNPLIQRVLAEFDEKFTIKSNAGTPLVRYTDATQIKSFLLHQLEEAVRETREDLAQQLRGLVEVQKRSAVDEYMRGLANGLICALACVEDKDPVYLEPRRLDERNETIK